jgi:uncharacterized protein
MDLAVIDADVLIHLAKLNQLNLLKTQFSKILITDIIYNETVIQGLSAKKKDAIIIKNFIKTNFISIKEISTEKIILFMKKYNIHKGESSIIALAEKMRLDYCITNEIKVRNAIKSEGFKVTGTLGIILKAYNLDQINKSKCLKILNIIKNNPKEYRFHPKLVRKAIKEVKGKK